MWTETFHENACSFKIVKTSDSACEPMKETMQQKLLSAYVINYFAYDVTDQSTADRFHIYLPNPENICTAYDGWTYVYTSTFYSRPLAYATTTGHRPHFEIETF